MHVFTSYLVCLMKNLTKYVVLVVNDEPSIDKSYKVMLLGPRTHDVTPERNAHRHVHHKLWRTYSSDIEYR